jgi:pseudouridine synthase
MSIKSRPTTKKTKSGVPLPVTFMKNTGKKKSAFKEKISKRLKSQKDLARIREYEQATEKSRAFQERKKAEKLTAKSAVKFPKKLGEKTRAGKSRAILERIGITQTPVVSRAEKRADKFGTTPSPAKGRVGVGFKGNTDTPPTPSSRGGRTHITTFKKTLPPGLERLEKHLAATGICSRREAKEFINKGLVLVNGIIIREPGHGVSITDDITVKHDKIAPRETVLFYKPRGVETVATSPESIDIKKKYPKFAHLSPIGRLDKNTDGLILLSNDGTLTKYLTSEDTLIDKEYLVKVREAVLPEDLAKMARGIKLDGTMTLPAVTKRVDRHSFTIVLREGRRHQVRRMCDACSLTVHALTRIRIGHLKAMGRMSGGNSKKLTDIDLTKLRK